MPLARAVRRTLRGPVRTRLREQQALHPLLRGRRVGGPPDYVGIGVQRCGTSWWQALIEEHPDVASLGMGAKELHFFDAYWSADFGQPDIDRYHAHFLRAGGQRIGEWTPRYLHDPWSVPLLLRAAPQARLLVLLRDPVARFRSGLKHAHKLGRGVGADAATEAFERGRYAAQLGRVLELVPRSQLLVLQFERCVREPRAMLRRTFDFLELPRADIAIRPALNSSDGPLIVSSSVLAEIRNRYRPDVERLCELLPSDIDAHLWPETMG